MNLKYISNNFHHETSEKMKEITFTLIRKKYPEVTAETFDSFKILELNNLQITHIDNLEVLSHIEELSLSYNLISKIENIEFLSNLRVLDLSNNHISGISLKESLSLIPKSLESINLINNPCCEDEITLLEFQNRFPSLGIIVGITNEEDNEDELNFQDGSDDDKTDQAEDSHENTIVSEIDIFKYRHLNADDVLKSLVERKCYQKPRDFNLESTVSKLNDECESALGVLKPRHKFGNIVTNNSISIGDRESKFNDLYNLSKENHHDTNDFMDRLRDNSLELRNNRMPVKLIQLETKINL